MSPFLVFKSIQHPQYTEAVPPSEDPPISAVSPTELDGAIKIPKRHKKPLRRVEVGASAGLHERSAVPHLQTSSVFALVCLTHRGQTRTKCPADQEALNFYSLHFHSHLSGISMMFISIMFTNLSGEV